MKVLAFDTSNQALSVAILDGDAVLAQTLLTIKKNHSITLMPSIDFLMASVEWSPKDLERIVVAQGPGSYTGLRMAVATAKTLAYALECELVGISSLLSLCDSSSEGVTIPLIDARRQHVYAGFYQDKSALLPDAYRSIEEVLHLAKTYEQVTFVGEVSAFSDLIAQELPQAKLEASLPSAALIGRLGQHLSAQDIDAFVPHYLKKVEAEENWLKSHEETTVQYVKRV